MIGSILALSRIQKNAIMADNKKKKIEGLPGKFLQPPAELPLTQRPWLTETVQLCLSSPCNVSGVKLHISNFEKFLLKSSKDILEGKMKKEACRRTFWENLKDLSSATGSFFHCSHQFNMEEKYATDSRTPCSFPTGPNRTVPAEIGHLLMCDSVITSCGK